MKLAILDNNTTVGARISDLVNAADYGVSEFSDIDSLINALKRDSFHLLIIDWTLSGSSGSEVLAYARMHVAPVPPTIMITACGGGFDIISELSAGADDYVLRPFHDEVLKARISSMLRRANGEPSKRSTQKHRHSNVDTREGTTLAA